MSFAEKFGIPEYGFRLIIGRTRIEYCPEKEQINRKKHGYSLESAKLVFERMLLLSDVPHAMSDPFLENGEVRHMHLSVDDSGHVVFMVTTMREGESVRIISFRRANEVEKLKFKGLTSYVESGL